MYRATRKRDMLGLNKAKQIGHIHIDKSLQQNDIHDILTKIIQNAHK